MFPWVQNLFGNTAWGARRKTIVVSALAALVISMVTAATVDCANLGRLEARTKEALDVAARGAVIAYGDGVARSEANARDVARQIFRSAAPSAATADPRAFSLEFHRDGRMAVARWEGVFCTSLGAFFHRGDVRITLTARLAAPVNGGVVGAASLARAHRL